MMKIVCMVCESTDFVQEDEYFVCQKCKCKFSAEEIKKMVTELKDGEPSSNLPQSILEECTDSAQKLHKDKKKTFNLTVRRASQFFLIQPKMKMELDGKTYIMGKDDILVLPLETKLYLASFSCSFRKCEVYLDMKKDTTVILSFNRVTGALEAELLI